jgi:hypothetical protein
MLDQRLQPAGDGAAGGLGAGGEQQEEEAAQLAVAERAAARLVGAGVDDGREDVVPGMGALFGD